MAEILTRTRLTIKDSMLNSPKRSLKNQKRSLLKNQSMIRLIWGRILKKRRLGRTNPSRIQARRSASTRTLEKRTAKILGRRLTSTAMVLILTMGSLRSLTDNPRAISLLTRKMKFQVQAERKTKSRRRLKREVFLMGRKMSRNHKAKINWFSLGRLGFLGLYRKKVL